MLDNWPEVCYTIITKGKENPQHQKGSKMTDFTVMDAYLLEEEMYEDRWAYEAQDEEEED